MRSLTICAFVASAFLGVGCGDGFDLDGGPPDDHAADSSLDAGSPGTANDAATSPPEEEGPPLLARGPGGLDGDGYPSEAGYAECYAADEGSPGCDQPSCATVRSCCIGDGACCAAVARGALEASFTTEACTENQRLEECAPGVVAFGSPSSIAIGSDIAPGGDLDGVAGVLSAERIDLVLHRLRLTATFVPPDSCTGDCAETVALGVTEQSFIAGPVRAVAALLYSGRRHRMVLLIGDTPVAHWDDVTEAEEWVLDLRPDGTVVVERGSADPVHAQYRPRASVAAGIWGRTLNPGAERLPTRLRSVSIAASLCDVAAGWRDRNVLSVTIDEGAALRARDSASAPSVAGDVLAFEVGGAIRLARANAPGSYLVEPGLALEANPDVDFMSSTVGDPELLATDTGYSLYFTATSRAGATSIGRVDLAMDLTHSGGPVSVLSPSVVSADHVREPTVQIHEFGDALIMSVRASGGGASWLALGRSTEGGPFIGHGSPALRALSRRGPQAVISDFDQDEVGNPSLVIHNGAWKLYYTGRRGSRESIGLLVSDDLINWRSLGDVFPAGDAPFEALSVRQADVTTTTTGLSMVYVGSDGVFPTLAGAARLGTDAGRR